LRGILLTHGHLDHAFNAAHLADEFGAWIAAPHMDEHHLAGRHAYKGLSRVCGLMEALGRGLLAYRAPQVTSWLADGGVIPAWGGLVAVGLPGHTLGHMGFHAPARNLLFTGDLFASSLGRAWLPPPIFNSCPDMIRGSLRKVLRLKPDGLVPNHGDRAMPAEHWRRFCERWERLEDA
jgi:glyoxylase-like metal-dependent hydrolase (beta-lactamase superfamily II)